jgi:hypothetical protein
MIKRHERVASVNEGNRKVDVLQVFFFFFEMYVDWVHAHKDIRLPPTRLEVTYLTYIGTQPS